MTLDELNLNPILGSRTGTYIPRFTRLLEKAGGDPRQAEKSRGWNWLAFLFTGFWMIYHRMTARGLAVLGLISVLPVVMGPSAFAPIAGLQIILGLYGDAILFKHVREKAAIRVGLGDDAQRASFDRQHAGAVPALAWSMVPVFFLANALLEPEVRHELAGLIGTGRSCSATATQDLVRQIAVREYFEGADSTLRTLQLTRDDVLIQIEDIRELGADRRKTACAAQIVLLLSDPFRAKVDAQAPIRHVLTSLGFDKEVRLPITYDLTTTDDGRLYAEISGLTGRR